MIYSIERISGDLSWLVILITSAIAYRRSPRAALALQVVGLAIGVCCYAVAWVVEYARSLVAPNWWEPAQYVLVCTSVILFAVGYFWERLERRGRAQATPSRR